MEKVKKVWKIAKKVLFWIFFVCLFLITTITVILHIYEDVIKEFAIAVLNSYLKEDVEVGRIDVSIFHQFPRASIGFENVFISDAFDRVESNDTLLYAEEFYFHFNLWDIWSGDYKVKRASIHKGQFNLKTTSDGDVNYNILKEPTDTVETEGNFRFLLELFRVEDMAFSLYNQSTNRTPNSLHPDAYSYEEAPNSLLSFGFLALLLTPFSSQVLSQPPAFHYTSQTIHVV